MLLATAESALAAKTSPVAEEKLSLSQGWCPAQGQPQPMGELSSCPALPAVTHEHTASFPTVPSLGLSDSSRRIPKLSSLSYLEPPTYDLRVPAPQSRSPTSSNPYGTPHFLVQNHCSFIQRETPVKVHC
jgi:hypothetical protein